MAHEGVSDQKDGLTRWIHLASLTQDAEAEPLQKTILLPVVVEKFHVSFKRQATDSSPVWFDVPNSY